MIEVIINGLRRELICETTLDEIITELQIEDKVMACSVNMTIVKKENWNSYVVKNNDKIELLEFVGGG